MKEGEISARFTTALRQYYKCVVFKVHGHTMQQPGWPDFYLATEGFNGWIETKGSTTTLKPLQKTVIGRLKKVGVPVYILRFVTDRHFALEDEEGNVLDEFTFDRWVDGAEAFLSALYAQEKIRCGVRANQTL